MAIANKAVRTMKPTHPGEMLRRIQPLSVA